MEAIKLRDRYFIITHPSFESKVLAQTLPFKLFVLPKDSSRDKIFALIKEQNKIPFTIESSGFSGFFSLDLIISTMCNLRCVYCCALSPKIQGYYGLKPQNMSFEVARKTIELAVLYFQKELLKQKVSSARFDLFFTGGEPLLNIPTIEFILHNLTTRLKKISQTMNIPIELSPEVATNGIFITQKVAELFKKYNVQAAITHDGPWHDQRRVYPNKIGSSKDVIRGLRILIKNKNLIKLQTVLSLDKITQVAQIFHYYEKHKLINGVRTINVIPQAASIFDRYLTKDKSKIPRLDEKLYRKYGFLIFKLSKKFGLDVKNYQERLFRSIQIGGLSYRCPAGLWKFAIAPDGSIFPCHQLTNIKEFYMGNVGKTSSLNENLKKVQKVFRNRTVFKAKPCKDCLFQTICIPFVDCPARCFIETGDLFSVPEYYCKIHKPYMEKLFEEFLVKKTNAN